MKIGRSQEVSVRGIAAGGSGVADLPDGRVVFVPRTAPGDRARIRIEKSKGRWAVGAVQAILDASPERVDPACALYATCGGCQLQHLPYASQLRAKGQIIADALGRIGGLKGVEAPEVVASPEPLRYRNRVTYTLRRLRGGYLVAGFHALGRPGHVIDVAGQCVLPDDALRAAWLRIREAWGEGASHLPAAGRLQLTLRLVEGAVVGEGVVEGTVVEEGVVEEGVALVVRGGAPGWSAGPLVSAVPDLVAVYHLPTDSDEASLAAGRAIAGGGVAFEQVNGAAAQLLHAHVLELADGISDAPSSAVDAYCGTGDYGGALAERGWTVVGIESDPDAVAVARAGAPESFDVVHGLVEERLEGALPTDLLVVNPPRAGLDSEVPRLVLANAPAHVVYVSCDPGTLARDLRALGDGYDLTSVRGFDLFPQTAHVETVVLLTRKTEPA